MALHDLCASFETPAKAGSLYWRIVRFWLLDASSGVATPEEAPSVGSSAPKPPGLFLSLIAFGSSRTRMVA